MTGMAVLLLVRPIVRHRDRFAQSDERGDGWSADGEHLDRAREHRGSNAGFLLGHHLGSGRLRQSDGAVAAVGHDDVAGDVSLAHLPLAHLSLAHLWRPKRAQTNDSFPRIPSDAVSGAMTALELFFPSRLPVASSWSRATAVYQRLAR